jgi:hypothetical protein
MLATQVHVGNKADPSSLSTRMLDQRDHIWDGATCIPFQTDFLVNRPARLLQIPT